MKADILRQPPDRPALKDSHRKILDAVIARAERDCPGSLDLIGIYGSVLTGDVHAHSDLDLLILIRDAQGVMLADGFILDDEQVGYDIYCTPRSSLEADAQCPHAHLSKLMDSFVYYSSGQAADAYLADLRAKAGRLLASEKRLDRANALLAEAGRFSVDAERTTDLSELRCLGALLIDDCLGALMLHSGGYFRKGVKRCLEEIDAIPHPDGIRECVYAIIRAENAERLKAAGNALYSCTADFIGQKAAPGPKDIPIDAPAGQKEAPSAGNLSGTYEEMFSNWRSKMVEAAAEQDVFSSFMDLASLQLMLKEIEADIDIAPIDVMRDFRADDLHRNAEAFDRALALYRREYDRAGLTPKHFPDADAFIKTYLGQ